MSDFFRPNVWPNTPDILHESLQLGGRAAFAVRVTLAATLAATYGIYGPAFELAEGRPREPGSEEYLDSEKYQLRSWDLEREDSLAPLIGRLNRIRAEHPALQSNERLRFHDIDEEEMLAYSKQSADGTDVVLTVVNLDPRRARSGMLTLPLDQLGIDPAHAFEVHDMLTDEADIWHGAQQRITLDPTEAPAHVYHLRAAVRTELQFDPYQ